MLIFELATIIGGSTLLSIAGLYAVRKRVPRQNLEACHEVGGYLLAIIGTLYAILLGLIVVSSQSKVDQATQMAVTESNMLSNIYHVAHAFQPPLCQKIRHSIHEYAIAACKEDWERIEEGSETEHTIGPYRQLWKDVTSYVPKAANEQACYSTLVEDLQQLSAARKYRVVVAHVGLSTVLWSVLIAGGVMIVLFTYFFFLESSLAQVIMTAFVAIFLSMNIYLVFVFQNPYRPELGVKNAGFGKGFMPSWFLGDPQTPAAK